MDLGAGNATRAALFELVYARNNAIDSAAFALYCIL